MRSFCSAVFQSALVLPASLNAVEEKSSVKGNPGLAAKPPQANPTPKPTTTKTEKKIGSSSTEERLSRIKKMYEDGLITEEEYDLKRREIIESF